MTLNQELVTQQLIVDLTKKVENLSAENAELLEDILRSPIPQTNPANRTFSSQSYCSRGIDLAKSQRIPRPRLGTEW